MSASGFTPIQLYRTSTAAATPSAGNLADGELAINLTDEKLYFKNASGVVKLLASNSGSLGSVTSVNASGSTTGLTFTGGPITSSGTLTLGGTLVVGNGGTGSNTAAGARTNLGVPANDGTGATGTWGISVTGNAGTVTNGVYTTGNQTVGGLKTFSSTIYLANGGFMFANDGAQDTGMSWASDGVMNVVCNGVTVGQFNSTGFTGNAANVTGTVAVSKGGTGATSLTSGYLLKGNGTSAVSSSVVYDTGTNVGIGTSSPTQKLDVNGQIAASGGITVRGDGSEGGQISLTNAASNADVYFFDVDGGNNGRLFTLTNNTNLTIGQLGGTGGYVRFVTSTSERMRIDGSGNVGIGTTSPGTGTRLNVAGRGLFTGGAVDPADGTASGVGISYDTTNNIGNIASVQTGVTERQLDISANPITFRSAGSERMRIDSSGRVGIGTTSPQARLHVRPITDVNMWVTNSGADLRAVAINDAVSAYINSRYDANQHMFETSGSERVRITGAGNVGIGTSAPNAKLDVVGNVVMGAALTTGTGVSTGDVQVELGANRTGDGPCYIDWHSTAGTDFESRIVRNSGANGTMDIFNTGTGGINLSNFGSAAITLATGGIDRMRVTSTGNVGIGTTSPQARLHVRPTTDVNLWTTNDSTTLRTIAINDGASAYINWRRDANQHTFETNGSERVRFSQTGNVGIGTTSPAQRIHAATTAAPTGTTQSFLRLTGDATFGADFGGGLIQGTGPIATISTVNAGTATERMRIDTNGNVGINETAPDYKLDVNGTFGFTPGSSVTPVDNGDVVFELTNNTTLTIKAKGSDGVVRSATITLA